MSLFGDENKKYFKVLHYLPNNSDSAVTLSDLLNIIDEDYMLKNSYCSGYSKAFLRRAFNFLERKNLIGIKYVGAKKRKEYTYGENTRVFHKTKNENH